MNERRQRGGSREGGAKLEAKTGAAEEVELRSEGSRCGPPPAASWATRTLKHGGDIVVIVVLAIPVTSSAECPLSASKNLAMLARSEYIPQRWRTSAYSL